MTIREVKQSDNQILSNIIKNVFLEFNATQEGTVFSDPTTNHLFELFDVHNAVLWVAEINQEVVGCCGIYPTEGLPKGCAELVKFYISNKARGKGIGRALMEKSIQSAINLGYNEIYIESLPEFSRSIGIYKKQGFTELSKPLGKSGHTGCTVWLKKQL